MSRTFVRMNVRDAVGAASASARCASGTLRVRIISIGSSRGPVFVVDCQSGRFFRRAGTAFALILLAARVVAAQTASAVIQGTVADHQGGVLPGVSVTATNTDTGLRRDAASDDKGFFRLTALPPGPYTLDAKIDGFAPYSRTGL